MGWFTGKAETDQGTVHVYHKWYGSEDTKVEVVANDGGIFGRSNGTVLARGDSEQSALAAFKAETGATIKSITHYK